MKEVKKDTEQRKRGQKIAASEIDRLVGMRIRIARNMFGKKQEDLANYFGITLQQIQKYENGKNKISLHVLVKVSEYLNIPISYFIPVNIHSVQKNTQDAVQFVTQYPFPQHSVAEHWKPIGEYSKEELEENEKQETILQIMEQLTKIKDLKTQKIVLEFLKGLNK